MAACGFEGRAPGVGDNSFTQALCEELIVSRTNPFDIITLHRGIITRLQAITPVLREKRTTPILTSMGKTNRAWIKLVSFISHPYKLIA